MPKAATPPWDRMIDKFTMGDGCWEWTGSKTGLGYGKVFSYGSVRVAHRIIYELLIGTVGDGLELDHLCRNKGCVNPGHLEPVTHQENISRGIGTTHCKRGHERTPENSYQYTYGRYCRPCQTLQPTAV